MTKGKVVLPHFIIAGAMKCGTSSLHHILANHPKIFIPEREIHFYDMDDILQHNEFFIYEDDKWWCPDFEKDINKYLKWYSSFFEVAPDDNILGEDSTTYLASDIAAKRISEINPSAKIIIILRDPASRSYSHYWHLLRTGRVSNTFEEVIRNQGRTVLSRSLYKDQIVNFTKYIPKNRIKFIAFENFIDNMSEVVGDVLAFLGLDDDFSLKNIDTHKNISTVPISIKGQLIRNKLLKKTVDKLMYDNHLPYATPSINFRDKLFAKVIKKIHRIINPQTKREIPTMREETKEFLNKYYRMRNKGINNLVGFEIDKYWYE